MFCYRPSRHLMLRVVLLFALLFCINSLLNFFHTDKFDPFEKLLPYKANLCEWNDTVLFTPDGKYTLHLCYGGVNDKLTPNRSSSATIEETKIRKKGRRKQVSFEELANIPDKEWLRNFDPAVYDLYPQSLPIRETLQRVLQGLPLYEEPIFNPRIRFLQVPSMACAPLTLEEAGRGTRNPQSRHVVLVYKSGVYNFDLRNSLRKAYHFPYKDINVHLVFSIGLPRTSQGNVFQRDGFNITLEERAGTKLLEHSQMPANTKKRLLREMNEHADLLVGDYEDTYYNLTLKLFHTFQWAARFCRPYTPTFVFLDDDYAVNTPKLVEFIRSKTTGELEEIGHGYAWPTNPVYRITSAVPRWAFSKREIPWPKHVAEHVGMYSMWSYRHVHDMALAMHFTKPLVIDDVWLAMVQHKLRLKFTKLRGMYFQLRGLNRLLTCSHLFFAPFDQFVQRGCVM